MVMIEQHTNYDYPGIGLPTGGEAGAGDKWRMKPSVESSERRV